MSEPPKPEANDRSQNENVVDQETIRKLEECAKTIDERMKKLDNAKLVTQETLRMEFKV